MIGLLLAAVLFETPPGGINGVVFRVETETKVVDPAQSVFLRVELRSPRDLKATLPDLQGRTVGFSLVEDDVGEPSDEADGSTVQTAEWRLVPEPCAEVYKIRPFLVKVSPKVYRAQSDEGKHSFVAGPFYFDNPPAREPVTGAFEADPRPDVPLLVLNFLKKHTGWIALALCGCLAALVALFYLVRYLVRRVREHRMSPIERAWVELNRLLEKGLPGRGRYKDFYVELTMVVRRYVQRKYGIRAPHLTTEEFFAELAGSNGPAGGRSESLRKFLESADMVKFAGVEATPEMSDAATESARSYLKGDAATPHQAQSTSH